MSNAMPYRPRPGTLPARVIDWLRDNPDEELTVDDVARKWDAYPSTAKIGLEGAVKAGALALVHNSDRQLVYRLPTATAQRLLAQHAQAEQEQQLKAQASKGTKVAAQAAAELQARKDHEHYWNTWTWRLMERAWAKISAREDFAYSLPDQVIRLLARDHLPSDKSRAERLCAFLGLGKVAPYPALAEWINEHPDPDRVLALIMLFNHATGWQDPPSGDNPPGYYAFAIAEDSFVGVSVQAVKDEVEAEHTAEIRARNKVQAAEPAAEAAQASAPLDPAAQARGVRGAGGKASGKAAGGKKGKAQAAPAVPKLSPEQAMLGIAAAMQGEGAGADAGPGDADPAVGQADGEPDGRATSPDAGATHPLQGERDELVEEARKIVVAEQKASISHLQRRLKVGYNRAARLLEALEQQGVVGPMTSAGVRDVKVLPVEAWPFPMGAAA